MSLKMNRFPLNAVRYNSLVLMARKDHSVGIDQIKTKVVRRLHWSKRYRGQG
jgi:hypothetical protein